jgi:hypothetical protein
MKIAIYAIATIACLAGVPDVAGAASAVDRPIQLAQDVRIGVDRDFDRRPGWRWRHRDEGCREVTIRERRDGEVIVRHIRRCD